MIGIYDLIVEGIRIHKESSGTIEEYLTSLKPSVRELRLAYRKHPVYVPYDKKSIQSAYLLTYFPHYYQLAKKILREQNIALNIQSDSYTATFIGGGPGSEAYGVIKYLIEHVPIIKKINVTILDVNAESWSFSHQIITEHLVKFLLQGTDVQVKWKSIKYDLTNLEDTSNKKEIFAQSNLVVIQNCINEIAVNNYPALNVCINKLYENLFPSGSLLMIDLTSSVRSKIKDIESILLEKYSPEFNYSTLENGSPSSMLSLNAIPSNIVKTNLLTGEDGLIPRKYLKYDFSLLVKECQSERCIRKEALGFASLYSPIDNLDLGAIDEIKNKVFIGVDFGTSVSVISVTYIYNGELNLKTLAIEQKDHNGFITTSPLVPTVMGIFNNRFMLGVHAEEHLANLTLDENSWAYFKKNLGDLENEKYDKSILKDHSTHGICNAQEGLILYLKLLLEGIDKEVMKINVNAEKCFTWSVPANYSYRQKEDLRICAKEAGFPMDEISLVEEPISALINYVYETNSTIKKDTNKTILVVDFGAGTVDISILELSHDSDNTNSQLLAVERISEIGGNKINQMMADYFIERDESYKVLRNLSLHCEKLKKSICKSLKTDKNVGYKLPDLTYSEEERYIETSDGEKLSISYKSFSRLMKDYWDDSTNDSGVVQTIKSALNTADLLTSDIDQIILTGGGARNPYMQEFSQKFFDKAEIIISDNIQEQVSRGNALQAFAQHAFGKNIINTVLHHDVLVRYNHDVEILFKKGDVCPTLEKHLKPHKSVSSFQMCYGSEVLNFQLNSIATIQKLIIYVDNNLDINCEILRVDKIEKIKPKI